MLCCLSCHVMSCHAMSVKTTLFSKQAKTHRFVFVGDHVSIARICCDKTHQHRDVGTSKAGHCFKQQLDADDTRSCVNALPVRPWTTHSTTGVSHQQSKTADFSSTPAILLLQTANPMQFCRQSMPWSGVDTGEEDVLPSAIAKRIWCLLVPQM